MSGPAHVKARDLAEPAGDVPLTVEATNGLAQLYESQGRFTESLKLNRKGLHLAETPPLGQSEFALVKFEWRAARLDRRLGDDPAALAGYLRASRHLESIRQDLPIEDSAGKSTYQTLLTPIFAGLADLTLKDLDGVSPTVQPSRLTNALDVVELSRQAELQDYLGDRCSVPPRCRGLLPKLQNILAALR
jgi:hypothetical protein